MLGEVSGTDAEGPWVNAGLGHPMVDQDHRLLVEDRAQTMEAPCRLLKRASKRDILRNVDLLSLVGLHP